LVFEKREGIVAAPFRVIHPRAKLQKVDASQEPMREYFERLMKMIPADVVGLYLVGSGVIPKEKRVVLASWTAVCFVGVVAVRIWGTADPDPQRPAPPQWPVVGISAVAFLIWVYTIGGVFAAYGLAQPYIGSLLVLAWTFFVPVFYQGSFE
jgi:hypothetical protein